MNRIKSEIHKLFKKNYCVECDGDSSGSAFIVTIKGPEGTPFAGGLFRVRVYLPQEFPFKSPSIGFITRVFHPNIDETSGSVCLDVLNQVWSPLYDVLNIIETFLPQLLSYPNPEDPLNPEAGKLYLSSRTAYEERVQEYVRKYAEPAKSEAEGDMYEEIV
ncbi:ubiquitin-conjugating enzyme E2 H [Nematocida homosporus]|uniref:ubiquitin-conjugating enzyme E2 H n=1 Tax=Nematocida homosporus TaxID=1912981 RepID=UPI00221FEFD5|nr:ubiquitin-conjugating enzyme E2 H [Nematocida homosporus]KAI5184586.1 ubiquitin-conjugating enzyme E2 H [Nematocida homosporus]